MDSPHVMNDFWDKYLFLSNFYSCMICYDGRIFKSVEAAFQASKTLNPKERSEFQDFNPHNAKKKGRRVILRPDWENVKDNIMKELLNIKFQKYGELLGRLLQTGNALLIESND